MAVGAGSPNYRSAIGPIAEQESIPTWLNTMRCLLFIEEANSDLMSRFLAPTQTVAEDTKGYTEEQDRIKACCAYGADIDDDMIRIVLRRFCVTLLFLRVWYEASWHGSTFINKARSETTERLN